MGALEELLKSDGKRQKLESDERIAKSEAGAAFAITAIKTMPDLLKSIQETPEIADKLCAGYKEGLMGIADVSTTLTK